MDMDKLSDWMIMAFTGITIIAFTYVIANNVQYKHLWIQKCKDGGGFAVTTPEGYICINPSAIIEVD